MPPIQAGSRHRCAALDAARGVAVLTMVYMHLVATEADATAAGAAAAWRAQQLHGKGAVLFAVLAGVTWSLQAQRRRLAPGLPGYVARRSLSLLLAGLLLQLWWPTEILSPLALMLPLTVWLQGRGSRALAAAIAVLLLAAPLACWWLGELAAADWLEDGRHLANTTFGQVTLRYYLVDGNYPLLPWLSFPLAGALLLRLGALQPPRARTVCLGSLPPAVALHAYAAWAAANAELLGELQPHLASEWTPTSLPFALAGLCWATAAVAGFAWLLHEPPGRLLQPLLLLGRASLSHYLLHLGTAVLLLRLWHPAEDWSIGAGLLGFCLYVAAAVPLGWLWFRRRPRGLAEALWARASGSGGEARQAP